MSFDQCSTCKYAGYCTFPRNRVITECDEYEDMNTAPAFDWDLQEFVKLWASKDEKPESK